MMDVLTEIIRNVVALVLIFTCLELFLPAGELSRFIRLACGLILLALIVIPTADALSNLSWDWSFSSQNSSVSADYEEAAQEITLILEAEAMDEYENEAAREIASIALLAEGIESADAVVEAEAESGAIQRAEIVATKDSAVAAATAEERIKDLLVRFFGLNTESIYIEIREGG